jgi:hypothetical protein
MKKLKTYRLAPNTYYPPGGSLAIGRILSDPDDPSSCLNTSSPVAFADSEIQKSWKTDWKSEKSRIHSGVISIWARFLQVIGLDAEASVNWGTQKRDAYEFGRLDIEFVDPGREKIEEAMRAASQVDAYIKSSEFSSPVYMITGVMIARGAAIAETRSNELGTHMRAGFDGTPAGAPAGGGPEVTLSSKSVDGVSYGGSSDFVFAYRLREIVYEKGFMQSKPYYEGGLYVDEEDGTEAQNTKGSKQVESYTVILGLEEHDYAGEGPGVKVYEISDEDSD